ncbi:hypothetical protein BKA59DRAFT_457173 [Fusarium tricinctum]|uniref:Uncharacterized protein n=1 Tax=Fusarium tricinctum TaxID=61284 RepID=A0A8K0RVK4_9HYPO|nr:hypothetical protein BKA59DRAFT_457173 [Fusarium tricinctum]
MTIIINSRDASGASQGAGNQQPRRGTQIPQGNNPGSSTLGVFNSVPELYDPSMLGFDNCEMVSFGQPGLNWNGFGGQVPEETPESVFHEALPFPQVPNLQPSGLIPQASGSSYNQPNHQALWPGLQAICGQSWNPQPNRQALQPGFQTLVDPSWNPQPSLLPLGSSFGNQVSGNGANIPQVMMAQIPASQTQFALNASSSANNGFGNQVIAQQPVHHGNPPVQSAYHSARLIGAFTNNTLREAPRRHVPVQGPPFGFAQAQEVSVNISQNPNGNSGTPSFHNISSDFPDLDPWFKTLSRDTIEQIVAGHIAAQAQRVAGNILQGSEIPSSVNISQSSNSQDSMDISQSSNSHSVTPPLLSVSSGHEQLNPLQATRSQDAVQQPIANYYAHSGPAQGQGLLEDLQHNPNSQGSADILQSSNGQDNKPERPRPPRGNQGHFEAPGIRYCVRCRSQLAYCAVWCGLCKQQISSGLPGPRHCWFCRKAASGPKSIVCPGHLRRGIGLSSEEKRVLEGEGICKRCYKAEACPGILKCERCRADQRRYGATSRESRAHRRVCLNCTNIVEGTEYKNCASCRQKKAERCREYRHCKDNHEETDHEGADHGGTE